MYGYVFIISGRVVYALVVIWVWKIRPTILISWGMCALWVDCPLLLNALYLFASRDIITVVFRGVMVEFALAWYIIDILIAFKRRLTLYQMSIGLQNWVEIHGISFLSLVIRYFMTINLGQLRQHFNDDLSVVGIAAARIVTQPEYSQILKVLQMLYLLDIADFVFT